MKIILKANQLIDGTGSSPINKASIVIEDTKIIKVCSEDHLLPEDVIGAEIIEYQNGTILPGFIEMHSHIHCNAQTDAYEKITTESNETFLLRGAYAVRNALISGVTTMRDLGSRNEVIFPIKEAISNKIIPGPRLLAAGTPITTTGGHCNMFGTEANTSDDVIKAIRNQFKLGADHIKIMSTGGGFTPGTNVRAPQYPESTLTAAVKDANRLGLKISAHSHATSGIRNCVKAGIHNLIHCSWLSEDPNDTFDYDTDLVDEIVAKGIYVDPTLALPHMSKIRGGIPNKTKTINNPEKRLEILKDMWDRGVKFVTGMDSGMAHANFGDFAYIPEVMVEGMGITPMEAIVSATKTSAECLGLETEIGTLEPGKIADVVIVEGNPLKDIRALHNVNTIISEGNIIKKTGNLLI